MRNATFASLVIKNTKAARRERKLRRHLGIFLYHWSRLVIDEKPFVVFSRENKTQILLAII